MDENITLSARPGITGPTQLRFHNEAQLLAHFTDYTRAYREVFLPQKILSDRHYVANMTFLGDLAIIFQTLLLVAGVRRFREPEVEVDRFEDAGNSED